MILGLETPDNACVVGLNMGSKVCFEILHSNVLKAFWDDVP